jgi:serine/threonine protein kinase
VINPEQITFTSSIQTHTLAGASGAVFVVPEQVGSYRLTQLLGKGGMGVVYVGERQLQGLTQRVAIKIMPDAQPQLRARFLLEREVLSKLSHPHIAALLDAGETDSGALWYAMELVEGSSLLDWCNKQQLSLQKRISIFLDLCDAVHYAHQQLILHRDIKPGNTLISEGGTVKLIDFGIAKVLAKDAADLTTDGGPLTPRYAAPEQTLGLTAAVTTDLWQLGALLFELLCGRAYRELVPALPLRAEPDTQTVRLSAQFDADAPDVQARAAQRGDSPDRLTHRLQGDLDAILALALRDDMQKRYPSVLAFSQDLRAWQRGLPVQARRAERGYQVRQFFKRNRFALLTSAAALLLTLGSLFAAWSWAEQRAKAAERTAGLVKSLFLSDDSGSNVMASTLPGLMLNAAKVINADSSLPVPEKAELLTNIATRLLELDDDAAALKYASISTELLQRSAGETKRLIAALGILAIAQARQTDSAQRAKFIDTEKRLIAEMARAPSADPAAGVDGKTLLADARVMYYLSEGDDQSAITHAKQAAELRERNPNATLFSKLNSQIMVASMLEEVDLKRDAMLHWQMIQQRAVAGIQAEPNDAPSVEFAQAQACDNLSSITEPSAPDGSDLFPIKLAVDACDQLLAQLKAGGRMDTMNAYMALAARGRSFARLGQGESALKNYREALGILIKLEGEQSQSSSMASIRLMLGQRAKAMGEYSLAREQLRAALAIAETRFGKRHPDVQNIRLHVGEIEFEVGNFTAARRIAKLLNSEVPAHYDPVQRERLRALAQALHQHAPHLK